MKSFEKNASINEKWGKKSIETCGVVFDSLKGSIFGKKSLKRSQGYFWYFFSPLCVQYDRDLDLNQSYRSTI